MTALLEFENKESLDKLLKTAKIFGIYVKRKKENTVRIERKISDEEKKKSMQEQARKIISNINKRVEAAGEIMTLEEIDAEISEYRKEKRTQCNVSF
jgi:predicted ribosome quality control (RQC) complex YloA/Tae2 family protein